MKKTLLALAATATLTLTLVGCSDAPGYDDDGWRSENVPTPGGTVTCILFDGYDGDAISCDWGKR